MANRKIDTLYDRIIKPIHSKVIRFKLGRHSKHSFIFILGHMRSGSTLLLHILATNPDVIIGGERNKTYNTIDDLESLIFDICLQEKCLPRKESIFVDQINHARMTPSVEVLENQNLKLIFLIRRPDPTISSIVRTFQPIYGTWPVEREADYYINRLTSLKNISNQISDSSCSMLLKYEDLVRKSENELGRIKNFIGLSADLSTTYSTFKYTGMRGDPSERIKAGKILPERNDNMIEIPQELSNRAMNAYKDCVQKIQQNFI
jgi:hypothetical protein